MYYPGSEKVEVCARTFGGLADVYYHMPCRKEGIGKQDLEEIFEETTKYACSGCYRFEECWKGQALRTYQKMYETLELLEKGAEDGLEERMRSVCVYPERMVRQMMNGFRLARMRLYYTNRLLENREAMADQLWEMSHLLDDVLDDVSRAGELKGPTGKKIGRLFARRGAVVSRIFIMQKKKSEVYITMKAKYAENVPLKDLAGIVSVVMKRKMVPSKGARALLGYEEETVVFVEAPRFQVRYGISRAPKDGEKVSGDSFSYIINDSGEAVLGLSDGMGSGELAAAESSRLLGLLEQFLEAGVSRETAMKLINSTVACERNRYSTLDVCCVDLHSGAGEMGKLGAVASFLCKKGDVEIIDAIRVPAGLFYHVEPETSRFSLGHGDYIIMVTDGVLEAMIGDNKEEEFAELICSQITGNPKELAARLMDCSLEACGRMPADDMTIYVAGIWENG